MTAPVQWRQIGVDVTTKVHAGLVKMAQAQRTATGAFAGMLLSAAYTARCGPTGDAALDAAVAEIDKPGSDEAMRLRQALVEQEAELERLRAELAEAKVRAQSAPSEELAAARVDLAERNRAHERVTADLQAKLDSRDATIKGLQKDFANARAPLEKEVARLNAALLDVPKPKPEPEPNEPLSVITIKEAGAMAREIERLKTCLLTHRSPADIAQIEAHQANADKVATMLSERAEKIGELEARVEQLSRTPVNRFEDGCADVSPADGLVLPLVALNNSADIAVATGLSEAVVVKLIRLWREARRGRKAA